MINNLLAAFTDLIDTIDKEGEEEQRQEKELAMRRIRPGEISVLGFNHPGRVTVPHGPIASRVIKYTQNRK